jgi:hypothetical protein
MDLQEGAAAVQRLALRIQECAEPPEGCMLDVLNRAKVMIQERTLASIDKAGGQFQAYSTGKYYVKADHEYYDVARIAGGRTVRSDNGKEIKGVIFDRGYAQFKRGLAVNSPNLRVLGIMLANIGREVDDETHGRITMGDEDGRAAIGAAHEYGYGVPLRPWWGVGMIEEEYNELCAIVRAKYVEAIKEKLHGDS